MCGDRDVVNLGSDKTTSDVDEPAIKKQKLKDEAEARKLQERAAKRTAQKARARRGYLNTVTSGELGTGGAAVPGLKDVLGGGG